MLSALCCTDDPIETERLIKAAETTRDVHMIIERQGLKVRKGQFMRAQPAPNFILGLNNTICRLINVKLINKVLIES